VARTACAAALLAAVTSIGLLTSAAGRGAAIATTSRPPRYPALLSAYPKLSPAQAGRLLVHSAQPPAGAVPHVGPAGLAGTTLLVLIGLVATVLILFVVVAIWQRPKRPPSSPTSWDQPW
jgi:hypothetical protein